MLCVRLRCVVVTALSLLLFHAACSDPQSPDFPRDGQFDMNGGALTLFIPLGGSVGDTVIFTIGAASGATSPLIATYGRVTFEPTRLRYVGQPTPEVLEFPILVVNPSSARQGELTILAVDPRGLVTHLAQMAFEVLRDGYENSLRYEQVSGETREGGHRILLGASGFGKQCINPKGYVVRSERPRVTIENEQTWELLYAGPPHRDIVKRGVPLVAP